MSRVSKEMEDELLMGWHRIFGHRRGEFSDEQKAMRHTLQNRGLLPLELTIIAENVRKIWR